MVWQVLPIGMDQVPQYIQTHFTTDNFTEQTLPLMGTDGDEIRTGSSVIIALQPNGSPVMFIRVIFHAILPMHRHG